MVTHCNPQPNVTQCNLRMVLLRLKKQHNQNRVDYFINLFYFKATTRQFQSMIAQYNYHTTTTPPQWI